MYKTILIILLLIYLTTLIIIGLVDVRKTKTFSDFAVAGKNQSGFVVILSLLASVIGASTTMGIVNTVYSIGFPGIWWILFGSIGLLLQALFISEKVRALDADTLPHATRKLVGKEAEVILALIIVISWIGVIAGQIVAMNGVISFVLGKNSKAIFIVVSVAVVLYTTIGGQLSVVKTDVIQFFIIMLGIIACFIYLYAAGGGDTASVGSNIEFINENYKPINLLTQLFVIGGVYFLGPDIMSRNLISKDKKTAKKAALISGAAFAVYGVVIVLIGMWARYNVSRDEIGDMNALMYLIKEKIPAPIGIVLVLGLVSAILSSTDTCIINASSIFVKDILKKESIGLIRIVVLVIGGLAIAFAMSNNGDIISLLSGAYSVYTAGVIFPLFIAIMAYQKREIRKAIWIAAVALGGACGVIGTYFPNLVGMMKLPDIISANFSMVGMALSFIIAAFSVKWKKSEASD